MTRPSLAGIEQRAAEATAGPWFEDDDGGVSTEPGVRSMTAQRIVDTEGCGMHEGTRAFIAAARTAVPALAAAVRDVLALHREATCSRGFPQGYCDECDHAHPCPTVRALAAHLDLTDPKGDPR